MVASRVGGTEATTGASYAAVVGTPGAATGDARAVAAACEESRACMESERSAAEERRVGAHVTLLHDDGGGDESHNAWL